MSNKNLRMTMTAVNAANDYGVMSNFPNGSRVTSVTDRQTAPWQRPKSRYNFVERGQVFEHDILRRVQLLGSVGTYPGCLQCAGAACMFPMRSVLVSRLVRKISGNIKFPENLQPYVYLSVT
jgi:hypothetical protein